MVLRTGFGALPPRAPKGCILGGYGELLQQLDISLSPLALADSRQDRKHVCNALTAGRAFAARFTGQEFEKILGHVDHAGISSITIMRRNP